MKTNKFFLISMRIILLLTVILILGYICLPPIGREYLNSIVDAQFCTFSVSKKLGIANNPGAIKTYVIGSLKPGMSHDNVVKTLSAIASITLANNTALENGYGEDVIVNICSNPLNNIALFVVYSKNGELIQVHDLYEDF